MTRQLAFAALVLLCVSVLAALEVMMAETSPAYAILLLLGIAAGGALVWVSDVKMTLMAAFLFTLPVEISKAMSSTVTIDGPALSLFFSDLSFIPLAAIWLFEKLIAERQPIYWSSRHWAVALPVLWLGVSAIGSLSPTSYYIFLTVLKYFSYTIVLADLTRRPGYMRAALQALAAGLALQLTMAGLQIITGSDLAIQGAKNTQLGRTVIFEEAGGVHFRRAAGFTSHPNVFADYLTGVLPPMLALLMAGRTRLGRGWYPVIILCCGALAALLLSLSRGGWIVFVLSFLFLVGALWRFGLVRSRQITAMALAGFLSVLAISAVFPAIIYRVTLSDSRSTDARLAMMDQAFLIIERHPILGVGLDGYNEAAQTNIPGSFAGLPLEFRDVLLKGVVHNKYLSTFAETGGIGMVFLALWLGTFIMVPFCRLRWTDPLQFLLALGLAASVFGQAIFYAFDHFPYDIKMAQLFVLDGLLLALLPDQAATSGLAGWLQPSPSAPPAAR